MYVLYYINNLIMRIVVFKSKPSYTQRFTAFGNYNLALITHKM